jgi:tape measure domain-containing protein
MKLALLIEAIDKATGPLRKINDRIDSMLSPVRAVRDQAAILGGEINRFGRLTGMASLARQTSALGDRLGIAADKAGMLGLKLGALGAAGTFVFKTQIIDTAAEFETLAVSLEAVEGSAAKAQQTMNWMLDFAKKTPLETANVAKAYMLWKNAGIDPTNGSLQSLVDMNAKVGGSQENLIEVARQLGQSWMKNKLQQEEVNVLTERMIPVVGLLARAYGKSEKEVVAAISKGQIGREAILKLLKQMGIEAAGASEKQSRTWTGLMSTLADNWAIFKLKIMDAGPFDFLKKRLDALNKWVEGFQTPEGLARLADMGRRIEAGFVRIESVAKRVWNFLDGLAGRFGWENVLMGGLLGIAGILTGPFLSAVTMAAGSLLKLGAIAAANPLLAFGIGAIAVAGMITGVWNPIEQLWPAQWERLANKIGWIVDGMIESILKKIRFFSPILPNSLIESTSQALAEIDRKRRTMESQVFPITGPKPAIAAPLMGSPAPLRPLPSLGSPVPTLRGNAATAPRADVGGRIHIKIDSEGRPKVQSMASNNKNVPIDIDAGLMGAAA